MNTTSPVSDAVEIRVRLTGLYVYPVKSCRGLAVSEAEVTPRGLALDREWMLVHPDGRFITQRERPRLALVQPSLGGDRLRLEAPGMDQLEIPFRSEPGPRRSVRIWRDTCPAWDQGEAAARWFSRFLGAAVRLVRFPADHWRGSDPAWTGGQAAGNAFSDGFPFLVLSEESVADLNRRIGGEPLPMNRFRPNLVFAGGGAYFEDQARALRTDGFEFRLVKPCVRCRITTTDQQTTEVGVEPLRTLASYRRSETLGGVCFGQNAIAVAGLGQRLRLGMTFLARR